MFGSSRSRSGFGVRQLIRIRGKCSWRRRQTIAVSSVSPGAPKTSNTVRRAPTICSNHGRRVSQSLIFQRTAPAKPTSVLRSPVMSVIARYCRTEHIVHEFISLRPISLSVGRVEPPMSTTAHSDYEGVLVAPFSPNEIRGAQAAPEPDLYPIPHGLTNAIRSGLPRRWCRHRCSSRENRIPRLRYQLLPDHMAAGTREEFRRVKWLEPVALPSHRPRSGQSTIPYPRAMQNRALPAGSKSIPKATHTAIQAD